MAQCNIASSKALPKLVSHVIQPALNLTTQLFQILANPAAPQGLFSTSFIIKDHIGFSENDGSPWTAEDQRHLQRSTLFGVPDTILNATSLARAVHSPFLSTVDVTPKVGTNIQAEVILISGILDADTHYQNAEE